MSHEGGRDPGQVGGDHVAVDQARPVHGEVGRGDHQQAPEVRRHHLFPTLEVLADERALPGPHGGEAPPLAPHRDPLHAIAEDRPVTREEADVDLAFGVADLDAAPLGAHDDALSCALISGAGATNACAHGHRRGHGLVGRWLCAWA